MKGRYFLKINGQPIPDELQMLNFYFEYDNDDELLDRLVLRFKNTDGTLLDNPLFRQGNDIEFSFGQEEGDLSEPIKHTIRHVSGVETLQVVAYEENHEIATNSQSKIYRNMTLDEVAAAIARDHGLQFKGDSFPLRYVQLAQVNESGMHFLKRHGKKVNAICMREKQTLVFERKKYDGPAVKEYVYDDNDGFDRGKAMNFQPIETSLGIPWEITMAGMDPNTLEPFETKSNDSTVKRSVLGEETLLYSGAVGAPAARTGQTGMRVASTAYDPLQAKIEGDGLFQSFEGGIVRGTVTLWGDPVVGANTTIKMTGAVQRMAGNYRVARARHIIQGAYKILATVERNAAGKGSGGKKSAGQVKG